MPGGRGTRATEGCASTTQLSSPSQHWARAPRHPLLMETRGHLRGWTLPHLTDEEPAAVAHARARPGPGARVQPEPELLLRPIRAPAPWRGQEDTVSRRPGKASLGQVGQGGAGLRQPPQVVERTQQEAPPAEPPMPDPGPVPRALGGSASGCTGWKTRRDLLPALATEGDKGH